MAGKSKKQKTGTKAVAKRGPKVEVVQVDEAVIADAVEWINDKMLNSVHQTYLEIGNYVFEKFFGGDLEKLKSFNPYKPSSFKQLSERDDLLISKTNLHNSVRVAIQAKTLLPTIQAPERLSFTHQVVLLTLKNEAKKRQLAEKAIEKNLSSRELKKIVAEARQKEPRSAAGRPALPSFVKSLTKIHAITASRECLAGLDQETLEGLEKNDVAALKTKAKEIIDKLTELLESLG